MGLLLLFLFITVPLIEIAVFIEIGGIIGLWPTLLLVILTAALGSWQLRTQGLATLARARGQLDQGQLPARELFDGFCLVLAGALLLTPGFVTDSLGLVLFVPAFRDLLRRVLAKHLQARAEVHMHRGPGQGPREKASGGRGPVIDGDYREVGSEPEQPKKDKTALSPDVPRLP